MKTLYTLLLCFFALFADAQNVQDAQKQYTAATAKYKAGNYKEAIAEYTTLLGTTEPKPLRIKLYLNIGLSHHALKEYDKAIASFNEAIKLDDTDMLTYIDRGLSELYGGKMAAAKADFAYVISKNASAESMEPALYWTARINYNQKNFAAVIENCDTYFKVNAKDAEMHFIRGTANDQLKQFEASVTDYTYAITYNPEYFEAYANRGVAKINLLQSKGVFKPNKEQSASACEDLNKALSMGDKTIEDMITLYCK